MHDISIFFEDRLKKGKIMMENFEKCSKNMKRCPGYYKMNRKIYEFTREKNNSI